MSETHAGRCLCGAVSFTTRGPLREVIGCHCGQCRRQTGLYYAATNVPDDMLDVKDSGTLRWYRSSETARRGFCSRCGSALFWKGDGTRYTSVMAGAFDPPTGLKFGYHIFVADKGDFYEIADGLPQHAIHP